MEDRRAAEEAVADRGVVVSESVGQEAQGFFVFALEAVQDDNLGD